ncbi:MAG: alpha-isopropylmalate synthase regulatory domain-containing protein [Nanoarchaeota archaeon]|nr:alpha-isopropylmalate synthase regulatory domain-containing protein [Nanoarchaeota archaeon]
MRQVQFHDCTWRDGLQGGSVEATNIRDVKKAIQAVDSLGVHIHELGFAIHGGGAERIRMALGMGLRGKVAAFGRTRPEDIEAIIKLGVPVGVLVGKSRVRDAERALRMRPEQNLRLIEKSVRTLAQNGVEVIYDAEHAFDGFQNEASYVMETLQTARDAGASCLVLCDTTGGMMPEQIAVWTREVVENFPYAEVGFHGHNDCGLGVANAQAAFQNGATVLQGTFLGTGERCSNTDLSILMPNLVLKLGASGVSAESLKNLTQAMETVASALNISVPENHPWVGRNAFFTSAGMHASGDERDPGSYHHVRPEIIGNHSYTGVSDQSGKANVVKRARELGIEIPENRVEDIMRKFGDLATRGMNFNLATASFEMFLRRELYGIPQHLKFLRWRLHIERVKGSEVETEASLLFLIRDDESPQKLHNADGDGPVNALEKALKRTLKKRYPFVESIRITDFRVRMLERQKGSASTVRVICEFSNDDELWEVIAVHENIIEACWLALWDGYLYKILKVEEGRS